MSLKFSILFLLVLASCTTRKLKSSSSEAANKVRRDVAQGVKPDQTLEIKSKIVQRNQGSVSGIDPATEKVCSYGIYESEESGVMGQYLEITFASGQPVKQDLTQRALKDEGNRIVFLEPNAKLGFGHRMELEYLDDGFLTAVRWLKDKDLKGECEFKEGVTSEVPDEPLSAGRHWQEVFEEEVGVDGFYCRHKPEGPLCGQDPCKDWIQIQALGTRPAVGYVCAYDPDQMVLPQDKPAIDCQVWAPLKDSLLGVDGYFCKTIHSPTH